MGFTSEILDGETIIHDTTHEDLWRHPDGEDPGLDLSARGPGDYEYGVAAAPFPSQLLIPRSEWQARIQEMEEQQTRLSDLIKYKKLPVKNQASTRFCWANAPVHCMEIVRLLQNQPMVILSPASIACPINNFQNKGNWGQRALQYLIENGVVPVDHWPANAIDRKYYTQANKQLAMDYRVVDWFEAAPRNVDQAVSLLLRRIPLAAARMKWSHETTDVEPVWIDGAIAIRGRNSWGDWPRKGADGWFILQGDWVPADDVCGPASTLAI